MQSLKEAGALLSLPILFVLHFIMPDQWLKPWWQWVGHIMWNDN